MNVGSDCRALFCLIPEEQEQLAALAKKLGLSAAALPVEPSGTAKAGN